MNPIDPKKIRYIKLGAGGGWVQPSFERGEIHFGHRSVPHDLCVRGDWDAVVRHLADLGRSPAKAKDGMREIRDFYTLGANYLWITFAANLSNEVGPPHCRPAASCMRPRLK